MRLVLKFKESISNQSRLTPRAPDGWESPRFQAAFWLEVGSGKMAFPRPAHPPVTLPVGWHLQDLVSIFKSFHFNEFNNE